MAFDTLDVLTSRRRHRPLRMETDRNGYRKLKIRGKDLDDIPHEVFNMTELETLDLSPEREACLFFRMAEVPRDIGKLANLKILMLDTNGLHQLPSALGMLVNLERISLSNNHLKQLPENFGKLQSLRSLHAANNDFELFPSSVCELSNLGFVDFSDNEISILPEEISRLNQLETLLLVMNKLRKLPDTLCHMTSLRSLWIGQNHIEQLPRDFGQLGKLDWGHRHTSSSALDGNPLKDPPLDICKRGVFAIAAYFNSKMQSKDQNHTESPTNHN